MAENLLSKHIFGSAENLDNALETGSVDGYDILFLKDAEGNPVFGWIDKEGNKVIYEGKKQISAVAELPETGNTDIIYLVGTKAYVWDGEKFVPLVGETVGMDEEAVDEKITAVKEEMIAYTDEQIANMVAIVEI